MGTRRCVECGHDASERARFCEWCGATLVPGVLPLRAPSVQEAKILSQRAGIEGERKQVTVLYADIVGSMDLTRALESERWGLVLDRFLAIAARSVHEFEGTVNQFTGDGLLAVFGAPIAHEDHARRACLAALELQREVAVLAAEVQGADRVELAVRCGMNSGEVIVGAIGDDVHMDFVPVGNTTALGKRIEELAPAGSTAISAATAALVEGEFELRELGEFALKGVPTPQRVLELVGRGAAHTRLQAMAATRGLSSFVGREAERAVLDSALEQAGAGSGRAVGIVGDAGVGKSRLVHEFVADSVARGMPVTMAGCVAHGRYVPFLPVLALYREHFDVDERDDPEVVREKIGSTLTALDAAFIPDLPLLFEFLGVQGPVQQPPVSDPVAHRRLLLDVAIRALTALGSEGTAVLVLEDLHWIDDASDAFLEEVVEAVAGTRILLVATYRGEYDDAWARRSPHSHIELGPLDAGETGVLLTGLVGRDPSLDGLASLIEARTRGNPFFVEEVVQALVENGQLTGTRGAHRLDAAVAELALPRTVQAALAARIDRLPAREKTLLQTMSVVGQEVPRPLLKEVAGLDELQLADAITVLERGQWVLPRDSVPLREYVFKHPLTQEVAYSSLLSQWRTRAHRKVAAAIERTYPDALDERAALLAHHYEAAVDPAQAAAWHARAAGWAEAASPAESMRHWRRVRDLAGELDASLEREELAARSRIGLLSLAWRLGMSPDETAAIHAEAYDDANPGLADLYFSGFLMHSGHERVGLEGFRAVSRQAKAAGHPELAFIAAAGVAYASWAAGVLRVGLETLDLALPLADGDPLFGSGEKIFVSPLAHVHQSRGICRGYLGELAEARADFQRAVDLARQANDTETLAAAHGNHALLAAAVGEHEIALELAAQGRAIIEPSANVVHLIACSVPTAMAEAGLGHFTEALALAESNLASVRHHRLGLYFEPVLLATIARSKLALDRPDEALVAAEGAADIAQARGLATCALTAPITLAQVLMAVEGEAAAERADTLLSRALRLAQASGARVYEEQIHRERALLAS